MTKSRNNLDSYFLIKFNDTIIKRQENDIYMKQISQSDHLQLIQDIDIAIISFRDKIRLAFVRILPLNLFFQGTGLNPIREGLASNPHKSLFVR
jgi:hypothetical protein